jgi:uncharacterized membrane protein YqjE
MPDEVRPWLGLAGMLTVYLSLCLVSGKVLTKGGLISRRDDPGLYWLGVAIPAAALLIMALAGAIWTLAQLVHKVS